MPVFSIWLIGHVNLADGEINYNDKKTPLVADLYNLGTEIRFDSLARRYSGRISYDNGHLRYAGYSLLPHNLIARFSATPARLWLESAELKVGSSAISLRGDMTDYSKPMVEGDYDIRIHTQDFGAMSRALTPTGDVSLSGKIRYHGTSDQPLLRSVSIDGHIASEALVAASSEGRLELRRLQGRYELANGTLQAHNISAELLGGQINADVNIQHLDTAAVFRIRTSLKGIWLQAAEQAIRRPELKPVALLGKLDGTADVAWTGNVRNVSARSDLSLRAAANSGTNRSSGAVPVDGSIHVTYDGPRNIVAFRQTTLRIPSTTLAVEGEVSNHSNLQIQANANDLHQLAALASAFRSGQTDRDGDRRFGSAERGNARLRARTSPRRAIERTGSPGARQSVEQRENHGPGEPLEDRVTERIPRKCLSREGFLQRQRGTAKLVLSSFRSDRCSPFRARNVRG